MNSDAQSLRENHVYIKCIFVRAVCACLLTFLCVNTASICALFVLYVSIIRTKPLYIINSFKNSSAIIHFTLLLLALHNSEGIWEQFYHFIYKWI